MTTDEEVRAVRAVARLARLFECCLGNLSLTQYRVLAIVDEGGGRATQLARALAVAKPTVTAAVDSLVERGWLVREPVRDDRRAVRITLTAPGRRALREAESALAARLSPAVGATADPAATLSALAGLAPAREGATGR